MFLVVFSSDGELSYNGGYFIESRIQEKQKKEWTCKKLTINRKYMEDVTNRP